MIFLLVALYFTNQLIVAITRGFSIYDSPFNPRKRATRMRCIRTTFLQPVTFLFAGFLTLGEYLFIASLIG